MVLLMDMKLVTNSIDLSKRKKKWIICLALLGVSGFSVYKVYNLPSVVKRRKRFFKLLEAVFTVMEMVSDSSEAVSVVSKEFKEFLVSDSDEIPNSLKQVMKIAKSEEFSESLVRITRAMTIGVKKGYENEKKGSEKGGGLGFGDRVMDKVMSKSGTGFVSAVVGSFARNLVVGFYSSGETQAKSDDSSGLLNVVVSNKDCKLLIADCVQTFVSTAVGVYLDKTMHMNVYDDMFTGLTNPKHEANVRELFVSVCSGAVETLVKTSHQVLTEAKPDSTGDHSESPGKIGDKYQEYESVSKRVVTNSECSGDKDSGWMSTVSSTLSVPSNRKFVLDVTGRISYESMKSLLEFFFWRFADGLKTTARVVNQEVLDRGLQVIRYVGAKASVIVTLCIALYMHIIGGSKVLVTA